MCANMNYGTQALEVPATQIDNSYSSASYEDADDLTENEQHVKLALLNYHHVQLSTIPRPTMRQKVLEILDCHNGQAPDLRKGSCPEPILAVTGMASPAFLPKATAC